MNTDLPLPELGMTAEEATARFDELQRKLVPLWKSIQSFNQDEQTIVVVPSMSIDKEYEGSALQAYEERFLFLLLLLRQPRARLIYVTSQTIQPNIIGYFLDLLPGVIASHGGIVKCCGSGSDHAASFSSALSSSSPFANTAPALTRGTSR